MALPFSAGLAGPARFVVRMSPGRTGLGPFGRLGDSEVPAHEAEAAGRAPSRPRRGLSDEAAERRAPELVAACVRGEVAAREEFVLEYEGLVRFAIHLVLRQRGVVLSREELEDLQQSVMGAFFERGCRRLSLYEGRNRASFATFVRVCATRQTLDHLRQRRRRPTLVDEGERSDERSETLEHADPGSGPEETVAARERLLRLRTAVASLPAREQLLVRLHFVEGLEVAGVARALDITENATHVLKSRVRAKLRAALEPSGDE